MGRWHRETGVATSRWCRLDWMSSATASTRDKRPQRDWSGLAPRIRDWGRAGKSVIVVLASACSLVVRTMLKFSPAGELRNVSVT